MRKTRKGNSLNKEALGENDEVGDERNFRLLIALYKKHRKYNSNSSFD